jgi:hypothetical protein
MKGKIYIQFLFLFVIPSSGFIQVKPGIKKVYGYKQASIPGILPNYSEENDIKPTGKNKPKQNYNYWFYIELPKTERISVTGLWIAGIQHELKSETVNNLPVRKIIFTGSDKNDTTVMVPFSKNKIMLVYPTGESKHDDSKYAINLARLNELVLRYVWKNRTYYTTLKKLKELNPDVRQ